MIAIPHKSWLARDCYSFFPLNSVANYFIYETSVDFPQNTLDILYVTDNYSDYNIKKTYTVLSAYSPLDTAHTPGNNTVSSFISKQHYLYNCRI